MKGKTFFLNRYKDLGHELTGAERSGQSIRVNNLKISNAQLVKRLKGLEVDLSKINFLKNGYFINQSPFSLGASIEYLLGLFTLQEAAAQFPVEVLDPSEKDVVLDMTAAPGGKTIQMADYMKNKGVIISVDVKRHRCYALENNIERAGVENTLVYCDDSLKMDFKDQKFDKILLDAPCSGNFANDRSWLSRRDLDGIKKNAEMQKKLLARAVSLLKKDGVLVYATCSLEPEENEMVIDWAIKELGIKLEDIKEGSDGLVSVFGEELDPSIKKCCRFWPDTDGTQGFFCAKIKK